MVIHTPRLCGEPIFVGGAGSAEDAANEKRKMDISVVDCRPVVKDELLLLAQSGRGSEPLEAPKEEAEPSQAISVAQVSFVPATTM